MNVFAIGVVFTIVLFTGFWGLSEYNKYHYSEKVKFANKCKEKGNRPRILDAYGYRYGILVCESK